MKTVEFRLPQEYDKSFIVFQEIGQFFPCPWHYHPEYELVLVLKSTGRRMVGDHIGYFDAGDLVFMGPSLPHVWVNDPEFFKGEAGYQADAIVVQFVDAFLGKPFMEIPEMEAFRSFLLRSNRGMVIKGETREKITALMTQMLPMNGLQRLSSLLQLFDLLAHTTEYEYLASPGFVQNTQLKSSDHLRKINQYIMQNFQEEITLSEIAGVANMALTTFCCFFKDHYRVSFVEYLNTVRIGYACKLISEKDLNIVEAAGESGFNNLANFNRQFKKIKNMTPSEYRRTLNVV
ncbi:AraC family transcriptional regulator [Larkinella rosea]|uniref:AraC family transcriptional regulator n=1 Tax=Larkinella rosea TaxID=2025312 RepID=A0A3P1BBJ2_9BACT|nr:AraC family transcriptional regulator [Larkinella rosea]RRA98013.1 AraC family transcriptional regulator [Larkinella rosea]